MRLGPVLCLALASVLVAAAQAEELAAGISRDTIEITSSFTGADVVTFGAIEPEPGEALTPGRARDVAVVIRSVEPAEAIVRKKERVGPIWVNRDMREFAGVPSFYFVASTRPLKDMARADVVEQFEIGLDHIQFGAPGSIGAPKAYREAVVRAMKRANLYSEHPGGVSFLSQTLFRTTAALPANVPAGNLKVVVYLFANGQVVSSNSLTLFIDKTGIERRLSNFAFQLPWLYGIAAVALSIMAGFLSSLAFRERD